MIRSLKTRLAALAAAVVIAALGVATPARADDAPPAGGPVLSLTDLGTIAPPALYGDRGTASLTIPVPPGLIPQTLNATVELPINVRSGSLTVAQDNRTISRTPLSAVDQTPISIPLAGAEIIDNAMTITVRTYLLPIEGYCLDPTNPLRLINASVAFTGAEKAPATIADFLPPVLHRLTIAIPAEPSRAESDAAVKLSAAVVARYGAQPSIVVVAPLEAPAAPTGPFERQIVVQRGSAAGLSLQPSAGPIPRLRISGSDNELTNQVRLLSSDISRLALSSAAIAGPLKDSPQLPGVVTTLSALGQPVVSAVALAPQVAIGLDQTRLGRSAHDVRVHLMGSYTPIPGGLSARLVAIVGDETIDHWPIDSTGAIDRWVDVPDRLLQRFTTLRVSLNIAGNTGRCGEFQPLTLTIDGDSVVQSDPAVPPVPGGFQSVPQALMPRVEIGIGADAFADTGRAVAIVVGLQRMSALPLYPDVTDIQKAIDSRMPAILVAADGWDHPEIPLPLSAAQDKLTLKSVGDTGVPARITLDPALRYGSLQASFHGGRSLLVATSNSAPGQLDELLRWLAADSRRWSGLDGVALVAAAGRQPVAVRPQAGVSDTGAAPADGPTVWWVAAGIVAATVIGYGVIVTQSRRATTSGG